MDLDIFCCIVVNTGQLDCTGKHGKLWDPKYAVAPSIFRTGSKTSIMFWILLIQQIQSITEYFEHIQCCFEKSTLEGKVSHHLKRTTPCLKWWQGLPYTDDVKMRNALHDVYGPMVSRSLKSFPV